MRRILCVALGLGALAAAAGPANAQASAEGAAKLKAVLEAWQPSGADLTPAEARYILTRLRLDLITGSWLVEPDGDGYQIRTPGSKMVLPEEFESVFLGYTILACEPDQIHAAPTTAGPYVLSGDQPLNCHLETPIGSARPIAAEGRHTSGSIDLDTASVSVDIILDHVTVKGRGTKDPARIDRLTISGGRGAVDGRSNLISRYSLEGLSSPTLSGTIAADRVVSEGAAEGADMVAGSRAAAALAKRLAGLTGDAEQAAGDDPEVRALRETLLSSIGLTLRQGLTLEGLTATIPEGTVKVGSFASEITASDIDRHEARVTMRLDGKGVTVEPMSPYTAWIPTEGTVRVSVESLPLGLILPGPMLSGGTSLTDALQQAARSSMRVHVDAAHLDAPEASLDLSGAIWSARDAVRGQTGSLEMRLTGLDGLAKALQADPKASEIAASLTILQVLGRQASLPDGRSARDYHIELRSSGQILVNGADVQALVPKDL